MVARVCQNGRVPTETQIREALRVVIDPELRQSIVDLGMVRSIAQPEPGRVDVVVSLTTPGCPIRSHFQKGVTEAVAALEGVRLVNVGFDVLSPDEKQGLQQRLGREGGLPTGALARVKNVVCVGSGKGGVGKSTITANLAAALTAEGRPTAAMDADVWGYSIPRMLGVHGKPRVSAERKILPLVAEGGVKASMTLSQLLPQARFLVVTTPQPAAQNVAKRAAEAAQRFELEIAGVIENMSGFTTPGGERFTIFGEGGGQLLADELDAPLLGKIPLQEELRTGADEGRPLVLTDPDAPASQALYHAARGLIAVTPQRPLMQQPVDGHLEPAPAPVTGTPLPMAP